MRRPRAGAAAALGPPLLALCAAAAARIAAAPSAAEAPVGGTAGQGYRHWQRDVHAKADYSLEDFSAADPRLSSAGDEGAEPDGAQLTPKFLWTQDPRHVFITVLVKKLDFEAAGAVQHDRWWLNFSASGDAQRTVGARHGSSEARAQGGKRRTYGLSLPLTRPVVADRMVRRGSEGYTVFELRKEVRAPQLPCRFASSARSDRALPVAADRKLGVDDAAQGAGEISLQAAHARRFQGQVRPHRRGGGR